MTGATHLPHPPEQPPQTPVTTNAEFLRAVFVGLAEDERPMVVAKAGTLKEGDKHWPAKPWMPDEPAPGLDRSEDSRVNWYFTLSTYRATAGEWRRTKTQFARAFGVMLDDIGTKAVGLDRLAGLPPSYVIETSPGNHQAGYLFDEPCADLARVDALQEAFVGASLCDPGAKGPASRLGRLPVGINGKPKYQPPHACRLVSFNSERRYSIEDIITGLELQPPAPPGRNKVKPGSSAKVSEDRQPEGDVLRPRTAENAVLTALRSRRLYKAPLGSGKHDITCPWVAEHTDQIDHGTAYFEPTDLYPVGGFKCLHGACAARRMGELLLHLNVTVAEAKHKPAIMVAAGELHRVVDAAERVLSESGRYYQRGGLIVTVSTDPGTDATSIKPVTACALTRALSHAAIWQRWDARSTDFVLTDPPTRHVGVLFDAEAYQHLPALKNITRQPYLRPDGSIVCTAGFDAATRMFGAFDERAFSVARHPDRAAAAAALGMLRGLLREFSFAGAHDEAAALALFLTAAVRPALSVAPMFHIRAPQIASGKSYLSALGCAFAGPGRPGAHAFPTTDEECSKLLLSALIEGPATLVFDNLNADLIPHKSLCSALTEEHLTGRILGVSKTATVPTTTLFISSGNNVDAVRDMARRVVTVNLDPACETPATRRFTADPLELVRADRGRYVSAALTLVRAFIAAGAPRQEMQPLGSYAEWSRLVRAPLLWLGLPDPATAVFNTMAQDPDRETLGRLLGAWKSAFGTVPTSVRTVVERTEGGQHTAVHTELAEVVREIAEERNLINRKRLGRWIARHQGRIVGGLRLLRDTPQGGAERWKVVMGVTGDRFGQAAQSVSTTEATADNVEFQP